MKPLAIGGIIAIVIGVIVAFSVSYEHEEPQTTNIKSKVLGEITPTDTKIGELTNLDIPDLPMNPRLLALEIHDKTNEVRIQNGLNPLEWNDRIAGIATAYSRELADNDRLEHVSINGTSPADRAIHNGFRYCGDSNTIQLNYDIDQLESRFSVDHEVFQKKLDRYTYLVEYYKTFGQDNISVYNEMIALQKKLQTMEPKIKSLDQEIDSKIADLNDRIENNMMFDGFGENIALRYAEDNTPLDIYVTEGWMNSPIHKDVLLTESWTQEGIGVAINPDGSVIVTSNYC